MDIYLPEKEILLLTDIVQFALFYHTQQSNISYIHQQWVKTINTVQHTIGMTTFNQ